MAAIICTVLGTPQINEEGNVHLIVFPLYYDTTKSINATQQVEIFFSPDSTPAQMENAIKTQMVEAANSYFPGHAFGTNNCIFPDLKRG